MPTHFWPFDGKVNVGTELSFDSARMKTERSEATGSQLLGQRNGHQHVGSLGLSVSMPAVSNHRIG